MNIYITNPTIVLLAFLVASSGLHAEGRFEVIEFMPDQLSSKAQAENLKDLNADICAMILVETDVAEVLSITVNDIQKVNQAVPGRAEVFLSYREERLTISCKGVLALPFKIPGKLEKGKDYVLRLRSVGDNVRRIMESSEITLRYNGNGDPKEVIGGIDSSMNYLDFSAGSMVFRPVPGVHTVRLMNSKRQIWEKRFDLKTGEKVEENVLFSSEVHDQWQMGIPGSIDISTNPQGATIYLDQAEQRDKSPKFFKEVQPGTHQIDLVKEMYLPKRIDVEVKAA